MMDARNQWDQELPRQFLATVDPPASEEASGYAWRLIDSVMVHRHEVDEWLQSVSTNWKLHRMRGEDRNILRTAVAELWYHQDVPLRVVINEWIEVTKVFSGTEAPRFVNGILDRAARDRPQPAA